MSRLFPLVFIVSLLLILESCNRNPNPEGIIPSYHISYDVNYRDYMAGDIPTKLLPKTLDAYYTRHHVRTEIKGFMNQFSLVLIADLKQRRVYTLLSFFGTDVYYRGEPGELPAGISDPGDLNMRYTGDTIRIGGLLSERIRVSSDKGEYDIYATEDFNSRKPNLCTPFRQVQYPLTHFDVKLSYLDMELICNEFTSENIEANLFIIPDSYKAVNRENMETIINNLFTND